MNLSRTSGADGDSHYPADDSARTIAGSDNAKAHSHLICTVGAWKESGTVVMTSITLPPNGKILIILRRIVRAI